VQSIPDGLGLTDLTRIGRGGDATVYRARQSGRDVVLRLGSRVATDPAEFRRHAAAVAAVVHPHLVRVYSAGLTAAGHPYLLLEFRPGGSYADRLATGGARPAAEVRSAGVGLADALAAAHAAGIVHGDVKPGNVLLAADGSPALADFALAAGHLTPAYTAPEVFRGAPAGPAADVYALGATLYALLTGRPPGWPAVGTPSLGPPPESAPAGVPPALSGVLGVATAPDPEDRYCSAAALRDALAAVR
jgi:serine/threonine protein kinase